MAVLLEQVQAAREQSPKVINVIVVKIQFVR